jgi:hypothetical protein
MDFIEIALIDLNGEAAETVGELFNRTATAAYVWKVTA